MNAPARQELVTLEQAAITPMGMLQLAVQQNADIDKLEKLMSLQERWEKTEARKAFVAALNAFKAHAPDLFKNKEVGYGNTRYKHATLDQVSNVIGMALSGYGIAHRWDVDQSSPGQIKVTCILTHALGHSESVAMQSEPDKSGSKNSIQAVGSTVTYLQRYTLLAATGMAVKDQDTDGVAKADQPEPDPEGKKALEACGSLNKLAEAWKALSAAQRKTLAAVKEECKTRITEADKAAA